MAETAADILKTVALFADFGPDDLDDLARRCALVTVAAKDRVVKAGDARGGLFVVLDGSVRLVADNGRGAEAAVDTLREGAHFGLEDLLSASPARFSVYGQALSTTLLTLSRESLEIYLEAHPRQREAVRRFAAHGALRDFLSHTSLFGNVPDHRLARLIKSLEIKTLKAGDLLIREGDTGDNAFIVKEGQLRVFAADAPRSEISRLAPGDLVGEIALIKNVRRTRSVAAHTDAEVLVVPKAAFLDLIRDQEDFYSRVNGLVQQRTAAAETGPSRPKAADSPPEAPGDVVAPIQAEPYRRPLRCRLMRPPAVRQQSVMDCGAACLATVCRYYGKPVGLNQVRELAHVGRSGASMLNLVRAAEALGFEPVPVLSTIDHLAASHLPAVVNWKGYHWIVVYRVDKQKVLVADPAEGIKKLSLKDFETGWTRYTLFLKPTPKINGIEATPPTLGKFKPYLKPYRGLVFEIALAALLMQALSLFLPLFTKFVLDEVILKQNQQWLLTALAGICGLSVANLVVGYSRNCLLLDVSLKVSLLLVSDFYRKVLALPLTFFESRKVGDITTRFQENENITDFMTNTGVQIFLDMATAVMYVGLMFYFNTTLAAIACGILFLNVFVVHYVTPRLQHAYRDAFQKGADMESFLIESLGGWSTIKTLGVEQITRWIWENLFVRYTNAYFKSIKYGMASGVLTGLVNNLGDVAVLFIGALMVIDNHLTIGELVAFTVLVKNVSAPINTLVGAWDTFQESLNSVERMNDVLDAIPEATAAQERDSVRVPSLQGHIKFEDVTFRFEADSSRNVLQNINLEITPGQRIAFVGRSGSGKSTLVKLLLGFYRPTSGSVAMDGFDLTRIWLPSMRRQVGVVPQQSYLFKGTIHQNIALANPAVSRTTVIEAAKLAGAHEFIRLLSDGYDTVLSSEGANLSGGQRQRLCIARAFVQNPRVLVLDEATSALDNESERFVLQNFDTAFEGRTIIMIAHRLSTVRRCDRIVVVDRGNLLEQGTHDELMAQKGLYYYLSTEQLSLG